MKKAKSIPVIILALFSAAVVQAATTRGYSGTHCVGFGGYENTYLNRTNSGCYDGNTVGSGGSAPCAPVPEGTAIFPITGNDTSGTVAYSAIKLDYIAHFTTQFVSGQGGDLDCTYGICSGLSCYQYTLSTTTNTAANTYNTFDWTGHLPNAGSAISNVTVQHIFCHVPAFYQATNDTGACSTTPLLNYILDYRVTTTP